MLLKCLFKGIFMGNNVPYSIQVTRAPVSSNQ